MQIYITNTELRFIVNHFHQEIKELSNPTLIIIYYYIYIAYTVPYTRQGEGVRERKRGRERLFLSAYQQRVRTQTYSVPYTSLIYV